MKYPIFLFLILLASTCNDKSNDLSKTCSIEDPLNEIEWLKEVKSNMDKRANPSGGEIIQFVYQDQCVFWIDDCFNCADNLIRVYDYEQNLICEFGGIIGLNTCPDFEKEATDRKVLYENK
jgi:hypothetical protein